MKTVSKGLCPSILQNDGLKSHLTVVSLISDSSHHMHCALSSQIVLTLARGLSECRAQSGLHYTCLLCTIALLRAEKRAICSVFYSVVYLFCSNYHVGRYRTVDDLKNTKHPGTKDLAERLYHPVGQWWANGFSLHWLNLAKQCLGVSTITSRRQLGGAVLRFTLIAVRRGRSERRSCI